MRFETRAVRHAFHNASGLAWKAEGRHYAVPPLHPNLGNKLLEQGLALAGHAAGDGIAKGLRRVSDDF